MADDSIMRPATTSAERKASPMFSGCLQYIPGALEMFARMSVWGNNKHNPGQPLHHARGKSADHGDCILRHQKDVGTIDPESGMDHAVAEFWRSGIQLQELLETKYGWPKAPAAREPEPAAVTGQSCPQLTDPHAPCTCPPPEAFFPSVPNGG